MHTWHNVRTLSLFFPLSYAVRPTPSPSPSSIVLVTLPKVRTSALNIVLHVFSVDDPGVVSFLALEENHGTFFAQVSHLMRDAYSQLLCRVSGRFFLPVRGMGWAWCRSEGRGGEGREVLRTCVGCVLKVALRILLIIYMFGVHIMVC